eukprot:Tamp_12090.p1 GENE.Tamp_12090~~Tamp_12090.p1  ORF type:complete len:397 (+),score=52.71 Tamp_12090:111-1301(+)
MSGASAGSKNVVRVAGVVVLEDTKTVSVRVATTQDNRAVVVIRDLVQCALLNSERRARNALADGGSTLLATHLGHPGGILATERWPSSAQRSDLQATCEVRQAAAVMAWAVDRIGGLDVLSTERQAQLCDDIAECVKDFARGHIRDLRSAMALSIGGTAEDVDEELGALRLQQNQAQAVHLQLTPSRSILHSFAIGGECAHGCFLTRDGMRIKKVTDLVQCGRKTCMYRLHGSFFKQYSLELRHRGGVESLIFNLGLLRACRAYILNFNIRSGSNFAALRMADVMEFLQHDDIVLSPEDCGKQYMYLHSSTHQKLIARTRPVVLSTLRRVREEHRRWVADQPERTPKIDWFFNYGRLDVHFAILGIDNFDLDPRNLPDIVFNHSAQGRMCSLEVQE